MSENKFWVSLWVIVAILIVILTSIGVYAEYLSDKRDLSFADKGLQKYKVERCKAVTVTTEWHEAGWNNIIRKDK